MPRPSSQISLEPSVSLAFESDSHQSARPIGSGRPASRGFIESGTALERMGIGEGLLRRARQVLGCDARGTFSAAMRAARFRPRCARHVSAAVSGAEEQTGFGSGEAIAVTCLHRIVRPVAEPQIRTSSVIDNLEDLLVHGGLAKVFSQQSSSVACADEIQAAAVKLVPAQLRCIQAAAVRSP